MRPLPPPPSASSAGRLQMGRPHGLPARGARGPGRRAALLSALSRRRHRPAGFRPSAGRRGGDGLLEVDCNPNPLRELLAAPFPRLRDGRFLLSDAPGLGVAPDMEAVEKLLTFHARCR